MHLCPQAQGSISLASFSSLPFLPGNPEAQDSWWAQWPVPPDSLTVGEGKGEALS